MKKLLLMFLLNMMCFANNLSVFFKAVESKNYKTVESFINKKVNLEEKNNNDETALSIAVQNNDIQMAKLLVENGANVNIAKKDEWSRSYLAEALSNEFIDMAKLLIEYGADANDEFWVQRFGYQDYLTPLIWACDKDDLELCKILIEAGASIHKEYGGYTPLERAAISSERCTKYLIERGADINKGLPILSTLWNDSVETAELLIDAGVSLYASYRPMFAESYDSLLNLSLAENARKISKFLIEKEIRLNEKNSLGEIPITLATSMHNLGAVNLLIKKGVDINSTNSKGYTAIMKAVELDNTIMVDFFINNGADIKLRNNEGKNLLQLATSAKMRKFLISKGVK